MLVAFLVPVVLIAVNYAIKLTQKAHNSIIKTSASMAIGQAALHAYNPGKKWSDQKAKVYSAGAQALNDRAFNLKKSMTMNTVPKTVIVGHSTKTFSGFNLTKMYLTLSSYGLTQKSNSQTYFHKYVTNNPVTEDSSYKT